MNNNRSSSAEDLCASCSQSFVECRATEDEYTACKTTADTYVIVKCELYTEHKGGCDANKGGTYM